MSAGTFTFDLFVTLLLSGGLLYCYGDWMRHRLVVTLSVLIAWYFSFLIIFVLPLDVSSTAYKQCLNVTAASSASGMTPGHNRTEGFSFHSATNQSIVTEDDIIHTRNSKADSALPPPSTLAPTQPPTTSSSLPPGSSTPTPLVPICDPPYSLLPEDVLTNLWRVVYWSSQLLTWLILPLMQSYTQAGEFTVWGKLRSSLLDNAIYYTSYLFIALILVIYIALQPDLQLNWDRTKAIAAAASNTWGLFVLVLMLGYGLVEVPRTCWKHTERGYQLNRAYFKVSKLMTERSDAEEALDDALISLNSVSQMIGQSDLRRPYVDTILGKVPLEMIERVRRRRVEAPFGSDPPTEKTLIKLHRQVIVSLQNHHRTEAQWNDMTMKVFDLEDVNRNMISNEHYYKRTISAPPSQKFPFFFLCINPVVEWYWKCLVSPLLLRFAAGAAVLMSALIIWSEITFFSVHPPLSMFALFVSLAKSNYNYLAIEIICFITICYLSICTYYTIFKIRILNYYYLANNHQSDEYTLLFSGALLCRLTPPLCLNFLSIIHMDSHVTSEAGIMETAYTRIMGHMDVVSIVSDYFNIYFPIALLALTLATYFSVGARFLSALGFQQFLDQDSEVTQELVEEGKEHIKREKRRIQRLKESASRRREFASRFNDDNEDPEEPYRQGDTILKSRSGGGGGARPVTSPERSLLQNQGQGGSSSLNYSSEDRIDLSPATETVDLSSPVCDMRFGGNSEPPRNLFDDL